jgi:predicted Zn-dependent protease
VLETALSGALLRAGRATDAEAATRAALQTYTDVAELHGNLGEALLRQGRATEARAAIEQGIRLQPQHPELWASLAEAELALGQPSEAVAALERATSLTRPSSRAQFNLAVLLEPTLPRRAAAHFRAYLALTPAAADAQEVQARIARLERLALPNAGELLE